MNNSTFSSILVCVIIVISSCSTAPKSDNQSHLTLCVKNLDQTLESLPKYKSIRFIPLETNENALIGNIDKLVSSDNRFYILDQRLAESVYIYEKDGSLVKAISAKGRGPMEYAYITDIGFDPFNSELVIVDPELGKIIKYDQDGNFISEEFLNFRPYNIGFVDKDTYAFKTMTAERQPIVKTIKHNGENEQIVHDIVFELNMSYYYYFPRSPTSQLFFEFYKDTIWRIDKGESSPYYILSYKDRGMNETDFQKLRADAVKYRRIPRFPKDRSGDLRRFLETENYIQFFYLNLGDPAFVLVEKDSNQVINQIGYAKLKDNPLCAVYFNLFCTDKSDRLIGHISSDLYIDIVSSSYVKDLISKDIVIIETQGFNNQDLTTLNSNPVVTVLEL